MMAGKRIDRGILRYRDGNFGLKGKVDGQMNRMRTERQERQETKEGTKKERKKERKVSKPHRREIIQGSILRKYSVIRMHIKQYTESS